LARTEAAACAPLAGELAVPVRSLSQTALGHVRHSEILSGGALEAYGDCPMKWLVDRELQPERIAPEPDPVVRGSHMHDVLEQVIERLGRAVTPESLPDALEFLDEVLAQRPGTVRIRGAIDRVDVDPDETSAIVRDYKSGSSRPDYQGARWRAERR